MKVLFKPKSNKLVGKADGKKVYVYNKKPHPPMGFIDRVYKKINDDRNVPIVFQTRKQYLQEYIKNQEKLKNIDYPKKQETRYINQELPKLKNVSSRFTTYHNPYIEPRVVFFNGSPINKKQFKNNVYHEYGHELYERNKKLRNNWNNINPKNSPTYYGKTDKEEDFAESLASWKNDKNIQIMNKKNIKKRFKLFKKFGIKGDKDSVNMLR